MTVYSHHEDYKRYILFNFVYLNWSIAFLKQIMEFLHQHSYISAAEILNPKSIKATPVGKYTTKPNNDLYM